MTTTLWTAETLFEKLKDVKLGGTTCLYPIEKCEELAPKINRVNALKKEKNAIILAHSYVSPEIIRGVSDFVGDSYELSKFAKSTNADTIVFTAVKFMAETAKLLNPNKEVLVPSKINGCSLADSITGKQVKALREQYPDYTFVCYINTTADVKAECDVCVTSSNVYHIVETIENDKIYFLPDALMGKNVINFLKEKGIKKDIKLWDGTCYVHEEYDPEMIDYIRSQHDGVKVLTHPECDETVLEKSDFVGSTSQMVNFVKETQAPSFFMLTECGLTARMQAEDPDKQFVGSCTMCKYMKSNTLDDIERVLTQPDTQDIIHIDDETRDRAVKCIDAMFHYASK
jgi:quinolinate synthase